MKAADGAAVIASKRHVDESSRFRFLSCSEPSLADSGCVGSEAERVWAAVNAVYAGFLAGDREAIDRNIDPDATLWDSAHGPLIRGKAQLDAVRDARPKEGAAPASLDARDPVIDVFGDVALVRHLLVATFPDGSEERIRNTSLWRNAEGRWLCVHNHEDVIG
jgi:ketosteroid isomerase-like protein